MTPPLARVPLGGEALGGLGTEQCELLVGEIVEPYVRGRVRRGEIRTLTARNLRMVLHQFADVNQVEVSRLSKRHVLRYMESIEHLAQSTKRNRLTVVRCFCGWLVEEGEVRSDPCRLVRPLREPEHIPRNIEPDNVALTLDACPDTRARMAVVLMVQEGLRRGEATRLEVGDLDLANNLMRVTGKGGHQRVLHITEQVRKELRDHLAVQGDVAGPLLRSFTHPNRGLHPDTVSAIVRRAMIDAGVKKAPRDGVSPHALRHSCMTDMLRRGAHLRDVQNVAGHRHLATTERYLPLMVGSLSDAMEGRWYGDQGSGSSG